MSEQTKLVPKRRFKEFQNNHVWEQRKWIDTVDISTKMVDPKTGKYDDLPHIGPGNLESFTGRILDNVKSVKEENLISGKFHFNSGDIIYGKINPQLAKYTLTDFEGLASADAYILNSKNGLTQSFLYRILQRNDFYKYSVSVSMRTGMPKINRDELNRYEFFAPSLHEQKKIGSFLTQLDHSIVLQQRRLEKMKALKAAYLSEMFPAEGEREPKRRFTGFTQAWEQCELGEVAYIIGGGTPSTSNKEYWDGEIDWYSPVEIGEQIYVDGSQKKITKLGLQKSSAKILPVGTVLFTSRAGIGNTAILAKEGATNQGFQSIVPYQDVLDSYFIYSRSHELKRYGESKGAGSTFVEVSGKQMAKMPMLLPTLKEQEKIGDFFERLDNLIVLHQLKLKKLQNIKKAHLNEMFI